MGRRIINLGGGTYNAHIEGNYIQGKEPKTKEPKPVEQTEESPSSINTNGANYVEKLGGKKVDIIIE